MFEQAFRNIDDVLRNEAGCTTELDYTEQTSWLLFLKYLDSLEQDRTTEAELEGRKYAYLLDQPYRWDTWAAPKAPDGSLDHNKALTGDDLRDFVNQKLFPYLHGFRQRASGPNTIEYKIGEIFSEIKNRIQSGYNLREIIDHIDELRFRSQSEKHELSHLYEAKIKNMGNAGRNGGEYYTPRPLIRAIIQVVQPRTSQTIYDGACGSAGFLCEAFEFLKSRAKLTTKDLSTLQTRTFYGKEKKSLAYVIGIMNMILHGIDAPNIIHTNTLTENLADIQEKDRFDIILANPPFGGGERKEVQQNFPIRTGETAFLFLQHFIKMLRAGGSAGVVIKNTFLSNTDTASVSLRKLLLESCNLHTILDCPGGTFQGAGVKTVVLFFEKGAPTRKIWYYQLDPGRNMGKTNPLNDDDLAEFVTLQKTFADSPKSWSVDAKNIDPATFDLSVKNPDGGEEVKHRTPQVILDEIAALDAESAKVLRKDSRAFMKDGWKTAPFVECIEKVTYSQKIQRKEFLSEGTYPIISQEADFINGYWDNEADVFKVEAPIIIFGDHTKVIKYIDFDFVLGADGVKILRPVEFLLPRFFFYQLQRVDLDSLGYARHYKLLKELEIAYPPLPEQQRIVGILDEAFASIATAKANTEKNLQNARALFQSHLQSTFTQRGEGWVEKRLEEVCVLQRGFDLPTHSRISGRYPIVSSSGVIDTHSKGPIEGPGVATGRSGSIGKVFYIEQDYWPLNTVLYVREFHGNNQRFVYRLLSHFDLNRFATGTGVPTLNRNFVHGELVVIPESSKVQKQIAEQLNALEDETQRLESLCQRKLSALEELKKSLLHQALDGEL